MDFQFVLNNENENENERNIKGSYTENRKSNVKE